MEVYLIRHAQSRDNARRLQYRLSPTAFNAFLRDTPNTPLTALGIQQAQQVASLLAGTPIDRLYTSPFERALATATVLGQAWNLPPQIMPDLREIMPSMLPGGQHPVPLFRLFLHGYLRLALPGSMHESWLAAYRRAKRVWQTLVREPAPAITVVSHCAFLLMLLTVAHAQWLCLPHRCHLENGGITCVEVPSAAWDR